MDSNSAVSSSKEHGNGTADNEERRGKNTRKGECEGRRRGSALQACPLEVVVVDGGDEGEGGGGFACTAAFIFLAKSRKVHASINL